MTTARHVAADILERSRDRAGFAAELIDDHLTRTPLSPQDRRFVTQLVFGVIRRRGTLDALLRPYIRLPFHAVQDGVWDVLHLGAFQLVVDRPGTQDTLTVRIEHGGPAGDRAALAADAARRIKEAIRLSAEIELIDAGALGANAPVVVDKREVT